MFNANMRHDHLLRRAPHIEGHVEDILVHRSHWTRRCAMDDERWTIDKTKSEEIGKCRFLVLALDVARSRTCAREVIAIVLTYRATAAPILACCTLRTAKSALPRSLVLRWYDVLVLSLHERRLLLVCCQSFTTQLAHQLCDTSTWLALSPVRRLESDLSTRAGMTLARSPEHSLSDTLDTK